MERYDVIYGVFNPKSIDDLKPHAKAQIGLKGEFIAGWLIEEGKYKGQYAMSANFLVKEPFGWCPQEDIDEIKEEDK